MKIICLDFETKDPLLKKYGMGWCFKYHFDELEFEILGCGVYGEGIEHYIDFSLDQEVVGIIPYLTLEKYIKQCDAILCHNAQYDLGCLYYLFNGNSIYKDKIIIDTMILAKQLDQHLTSYSLDYLSQYYQCSELKQSDALHDYAWLSGIYITWHKETKKQNKKVRPSVKVLETFCKTNLDLFPIEIVGRYCLQDCKATLQLCNKLLSQISQELILQDSMSLKMCIDMKATGIRIDLNKIIPLIKEFQQIAEQAAIDFCNDIGNPPNFNINSPVQLGEILLAMGYKLPVTDLGNISLRSKWLDEQEDQLFHNLKRYRKALKVKKDFLQKLLDYNKIIPEKYKEGGIGWLFPSLKLYGATLTGRFSSGGGIGCKELSMHQIPRRDEEFGTMIREIFLPHTGEQLVVGDFSSQEPRLQVHYASIMGCTGVDDLVTTYNNNPSLDIYNYLSNSAAIERDDAKTIHLGLSYNMYIDKLAISLKVARDIAESLLNKYHENFPWMKQLQKITSKNLLKLGYIKTIGGRKLLIDPPYVFRGKTRTNESKGLSKLIQGSAGDQTRLAMISAWEKGLKLIFSVHDELGVSSSQPERDKTILEECMCNVIKLKVPMHVVAKIGNNWRQCK